MLNVVRLLYYLAGNYRQRELWLQAYEEIEGRYCDIKCRDGAK